MRRSLVGRRRMKKLKKVLEAANFDFLLLEDREAITWTCGCADAKAALIPANENKMPTVFTDTKERFTRRSWEEFAVVNNTRQFMENFKAYRAVNLAADNPQSTLSSQIKKIINTNIENATPTFWKLASVKDALELERFKIGSSIARRIMDFILENLRAGITEIDLNNDAVIYGRLLVHEECEKLDLMYPGYIPMIEGVIEDNPAIKITFGPNTAIPHKLPRCRRLRKNDIVSICVIPNVDGYWTEFELTTLIGNPQSEIKKYNEIKREILNATITLCKEGIMAHKISKCIRRILRDRGLKDEILHPFGHGLGLKLHEPPILGSPDDVLAQEPLQTGQVLAIEPGFYFPGKYGFRDSVTVVVRKENARVLTTLSNDSVKI